MRVFLVWKRRCVDVRAGTQAPPLRFRLGGLRVGRLILFVWDVWKNITEMGRGGACVPARVALQGRIRRSSPAHDACIFGMETPLRERSGGHTGAAPTCFVWVDYV